MSVDTVVAAGPSEVLALESWASPVSVFLSPVSDVFSRAYVKKDEASNPFRFTLTPRLDLTLLFLSTVQLAACSPLG